MPTKKLSAKKKKPKKMDRHLLSSQPHELKHMAKKKKVSAKSVRAAKKEVGRSRKKIEAKLDNDKLK